MPREAMTREAILRPPPVPVERQRLESLIEDAGAPPLLPTPPPDPGPAFYPLPVPPSFEPAAHAPPVPPPFEPVFQIPPAPEPKRMPVASPPPPGPRFASAPAPLPTPPAHPSPLREVAAPPATAREPAVPPFSKERTPDLKVVAIEPAPPPGAEFSSIEEEMASLLGRSTGKM
jgi:hypothetical protein